MDEFYIHLPFWRVVPMILLLGSLTCKAWFDCPLMARSITLRQTAATEKAELFGLIQNLENGIPFKHDAVSKLCGRTLELDSDTKSNEVGQTRSDFCTKRVLGHLIAKIGVKETDAFTGDLGGEASIELNSDYAHITAKEIVSYFGKESAIDCSPYCRLGSEVQPWIYEYKRTWGTLSFTVSDEEPHYLMHVFLNAWERRPLSTAKRYSI